MNGIMECLDIRRATIEVLRQVNDMRFKVENTSTKIKHLNDRLTALGGASDSTPVQGTPVSQGEKWTDAIAKRDTLIEGYRKAVEFCNEFDLAWNQLTDDERWMLEVRYIETDRGENSIGRVMEHYYIEKSVAYERCAKALNRLAKLLYW